MKKLMLCLSVFLGSTGIATAMNELQWEYLLDPNCTGIHLDPNFDQNHSGFMVDKNWNNLTGMCKNTLETEKKNLEATITSSESYRKPLCHAGLAGTAALTVASFVASFFVPTIAPVACAQIFGLTGLLTLSEHFLAEHNKVRYEQVKNDLVRIKAISSLAELKDLMVKK